MAAPAAAAAPGSFQIAVSSFRTESRAQEVVTALTALQVPAVVRADAASGWFRVMAGPFTTRDLARLLLVQSVLFALAGSLIGLTLVTRMSEAIRSPQLALVLPPWLFAGTSVLMVLMCMAASSLALLRVRRVEPGMVFR